MSKNNYGQLVQNLLTDLRDRKVLPSTFEYRSGKGLVRLTGGGAYQIVTFGTAKEIHFFLEGIQYMDFLSLPTNQNID